MCPDLNTTCLLRLFQKQWLVHSLNYDYEAVLSRDNTYDMYVLLSGGGLGLVLKAKNEVVKDISP